MRIILARGVSILAHPLVLTPAAALLAASLQQGSNQVSNSITLALPLIAVLVLAFSHWNVRSGRWAHIDASNPYERLSLNGFLSALLLISSAMAWHIYSSRALSFGLLISGLMVIAALALLSALKVSLHVSFAVMAAGFLWPNFFAVAAVLLIATAVAWSRLVLRRHNLAEICVGALLGSISAVAYQMLNNIK